MNRLFETALAVSGLRSFSAAATARQGWRSAALSALTVLGLVSLISLQASAATIINYGSFNGSTVVYDGVREAANSAGDTAPLFGEPTVIGAPNPPTYPASPCILCNIPGDTLDFDPTGFGANATGGGVDITDGNLRFVVKAKPAESIDNIQIYEQGDYTLVGLGNAATSVFARIAGVVNIQAVDGIGVNSISIPFSQMLAAVGSTGVNVIATPWSGTVLLDLTTANPVVAAAFAAQGINPQLGVTQASVSFDNTLVATSQVGTSALIAKKDVLTVKTNIPEPTSCALVLLGVVLSGLVTRRAR
jgi:hypothetical protein